MYKVLSRAIKHSGKVEKRYFIYSDMQFELYNVEDKGTGVDMFFYDKKGLLLKEQCESKTIYIKYDIMLKSHMIVFKFQNEDKENVLHELCLFCKVYNNYGAIVCIDFNEIIFFPKLGYQDSLLIKSICRRQFPDQKIDVMYGEINI